MGLSRRAAVVASGRLATTASLLVVNALLARAWPPEIFGHFSAVWILGNTLVPFFLLGIPGALLYAIPRHVSVPVLHLRSSFVLAASGLLLCVVLWALSGPIGATITGDTASGTPWLRAELLGFLPYVLCLVAGGHIESALVAAGRTVQQAAIAWLGALLLVGAAAAAWIWGWSVGEAFLALSVAGIARLLVAYSALWQVGLRRGRDPGFGAFLRYAVTIGAGEGVGSLSRSVDRLVVLLLLDPTRLGIYHLGAIEVPVSLILASVVTVMVPEVSRLMAAGRSDQVADLFHGAVAALSWIVLPLFFFLLLFTPEVMGLYLPAAYADSADIFRCFLFMLPLRCAIYNPILVGSGKASWALYAAVGDLALNLALSVTLVLCLRGSAPEAAVLAPALATVVASYAQVTVLLVVLARLLDRRLRRLVPWRHLLRVGGVSLVAAFVSAEIAHALSEAAAVRLVAGGALMLLLAWGVPARLSPRDRAHLASLVASLGRRNR